MNPSPFVLFFVVSTSPTDVSSSSLLLHCNVSHQSISLIKPPSSLLQSLINSKLRRQLYKENFDEVDDKDEEDQRKKSRKSEKETGIVIVHIAHSILAGDGFSLIYSVRKSTFTTRILALIPQLCLRNIHLIKSELSTPTLSFYMTKNRVMMCWITTRLI
ncbi:hypothetical protein Bca4012_064748 [Brassica carinata]